MTPSGRSTQAAFAAHRWTRGLAGLCVALAALAGGTPSDARAQQPGPTPEWLRYRLQSRFDAPTRAAVEKVIDSALAAGIPAEPLVDKALEGASKGARPDLILRAIRGLATDLGAARQLLGAGSLPTELSAGAAALRSGVSDDALRRLRTDRKGQPIGVALAVLTDLVASGVPAEQASRAVLSLTKAGLADEQLVAFRRDVERDIGVGAPPISAVLTRQVGVLANLVGGGASASRSSPQGKPRP